MTWRPPIQTLFKAGTLITATETFRADLLVDGEKISAVASEISAPGAKVIDLNGKLVMPGGVDAHTHFDLPMFDTVSSDDHYTGHKAAAFGGTTTVIDFVPQEAGPFEASVAAWHAKAYSKACIDFGFHMNVTRWDGQVAGDLASLPALGITSIKVFMAYNGRLRLGDVEIFQAMRSARQHDLLTMLHAENGDVIDLLTAEALAAGHIQPWWHAQTRPAWGAVEASLRGAALAAQAESPLYIVHMNAGGEADMLAYARQQGLPVMGETCPQYLFFTTDHLRRPDGAKWICSPPVRTTVDNLRLGMPFQLVILPWQGGTGSPLTGGVNPDALTTWFSSAPLLSLDSVSWSFAFGLSTLLLGVLLTAVSRLPGLDWRSWSGSFGLTAAALLAILAGNPIAIILAWTAFDLLELIIWLSFVDDQIKRRNSVVVFSIRMAGVVILLAVTLFAGQNGQALNFDAVSADVSPWLVLAAAVRLGVVPFQIPFHSEAPIRHGLGTILYLAPQAVSLALLARTAVVGLTGIWLIFFMALGFIMALFCGIAWILARDVNSGRPYWLLATSSMALIAAGLSQLEACLTWGVSSLLTSGFLFLSSNRYRFLMALTLGAALGLTMLPYTPLWLNTQTYAAIWALLQDWAAAATIGALLLVHAVLVVGFIVHGMRIPEEKPETERWIWLFYLPGLVGLLLANFVWGWLYRTTFASFGIINWLAGPMVCAISTVILVWLQRHPNISTDPNRFPGGKSTVWSRIFSLSWATALFRQLYLLGSSLSRLLNDTLEGEGGVLWAVLLWIIIFSLAL